MICQTYFDFGFVSLSDFIMPNGVKSTAKVNLSAFEMHELVKNSGRPNYLHCRLPVKSQLNIEAWKLALTDYWDVQLLQLLEFGFPLDFNRNHASANEFSEDIGTYLEEETSFGAIIGPFHKNPIINCYYSPFMTWQKSNSKHR